MAVCLCFPLKNTRIQNSVASISYVESWSEVIQKYAHFCSAILKKFKISMEQIPLKHFTLKKQLSVVLARHFLLSDSYPVILFFSLTKKVPETTIRRFSVPFYNPSVYLSNQTCFCLCTVPKCFICQYPCKYQSQRQCGNNQYRWCKPGRCRT